MNYFYLPDGSSLFGFLNGSITLPKENGAYVISSGCGAGKTSSIKQLIAGRHKDGLLYCVDSVAALIDMYSFIKTEMIDKGIISATDVAILYSDSTALDARLSSQVMSLGLDMMKIMSDYKASPEQLMNKKVLIITHARFWIDYIPYFVIFNPLGDISFDGDLSKIMKRDDLRKWILFDETPNFIQPFISIPHYMMPCLVDSGWKCKSEMDIKSYYNAFIRDTKEAFLAKEDSGLGKVKYDLGVKLIQQNFNKWIGEKLPVHSFSFTPYMLAQTIPNCHLIVFEGAGDLLFSSSPYKLLDLSPKYSAKLSFDSFHFEMERRKKIDDKKFNSVIDEIVDFIRTKTTKFEKTLIVVWKSVGEIETGSTSCEIALKSDYIEKVRTAILSQGIPDYKFSITYYGASDTKGSNKYKDFKNIILFGKWALPNAEADRFRSYWGSTTTTNELNLFLFVQLICRIGIRKHSKGHTYKVLYSDDYNDKFISSLKNYFSIGKKKLKLGVFSSDDWKSVAASYKINGKVMSYIEKLVASNPQIAKTIATKTNKTFSYTSRDICKILKPESHRTDISKIKRTTLFEILEAMGVIINIT